MSGSPLPTIPDISNDGHQIPNLEQAAMCSSDHIISGHVPFSHKDQFREATPHNHADPMAQEFTAPSVSMPGGFEGVPLNGSSDGHSEQQDSGCPPAANQGQLSAGNRESDMDEDDDDMAEEGKPKSGSRKKKPHLQGRFSGRLATKDDEKRLSDECRLLGPLLGGVGKRGDSSRLTLAKIVRGIASGEVRRHCEDRENKLKNLKVKLNMVENAGKQQLESLKQEISALRTQLDIKNRHLMDMNEERQMAAVVAGPPPGLPLVAIKPDPVAMLPDGQTLLMEVNNPQVPAGSGVLQQQQQLMHAMNGPPRPLMPGEPMIRTVATKLDLPPLQQSGVPLLPQQVQGGPMPHQGNHPMPGMNVLQSAEDPLTPHHHMMAGAGLAPIEEPQRMVPTVMQISPAAECAMPGQPTPVQSGVPLGSQGLAPPSLPPQVLSTTMTHVAQAQVVQLAQAAQAAQAQAQNLQVTAHVHAQRHAEASAQAHSLLATAQAISQVQQDIEHKMQGLKHQAHVVSPPLFAHVEVEAHKLHAQAQAQAVAAMEVQQAAQRCEAQAVAHAQAHMQAHAQAQELSAKAQTLQAHADHLNAAQVMKVEETALEMPPVSLGQKNSLVQGGVSNMVQLMSSAMQTSVQLPGGAMMPLASTQYVGTVSPPNPVALQPGNVHNQDLAGGLSQRAAYISAATNDQQAMQVPSRPTVMGTASPLEMGVNMVQEVLQQQQPLPSTVVQAVPSMGMQVPGYNVQSQLSAQAASSVHMVTSQLPLNIPKLAPAPGIAQQMQVPMQTVAAPKAQQIQIEAVQTPVGAPQPVQMTSMYKESAHPAAAQMPMMSMTHTHMAVMESQGQLPMQGREMNLNLQGMQAHQAVPMQQIAMEAAQVTASGLPSTYQSASVQSKAGGQQLPPSHPMHLQGNSSGAVTMEYAPMASLQREGSGQLATGMVHGLVETAGPVHMSDMGLPMPAIATSKAPSMVTQMSQNHLDHAASLSSTSSLHPGGGRQGSVISHSSAMSMHDIQASMPLNMSMQPTNLPSQTSENAMMQVSPMAQQATNQHFANSIPSYSSMPQQPNHPQSQQGQAMHTPGQVQSHASMSTGHEISHMHPSHSMHDLSHAAQAQQNSSHGIGMQHAANGSDPGLVRVAHSMGMQQPPQHDSAMAMSHNVSVNYQQVQDSMLQGNGSVRNMSHSMSSGNLHQMQAVVQGGMSHQSANMSQKVQHQVEHVHMGNVYTNEGMQMTMEHDPIEQQLQARHPLDDGLDLHHLQLDLSQDMTHHHGLPPHVQAMGQMPTASIPLSGA